MSNAINIRIGKKLTELLKQQGCNTRFEAAKFLDIPEARVQAYQLGRCSIPYARLIEFSKKLGVEPSYFLDGKE